jgi:hypothetical protein
MEIQILVPQPVAQAIIDYLQNRPHIEVHGLIGALMACSKAHVCPAKDPDPAQEATAPGHAEAGSGQHKDPSRREALRGL